MSVVVELRNSTNLTSIHETAKKQRFPHTIFVASPHAIHTESNHKHLPIRILFSLSLSLSLSPDRANKY